MEEAPLSEWTDALLAILVEVAVSVPTGNEPGAKFVFGGTIHYADDGDGEKRTVFDL